MLFVPWLDLCNTKYIEIKDNIVGTLVKLI